MDAEQIFNHAVEISDPKERAAYLDRACKDDERLRATVEALLHADEKAGDFLESPVVDPNVTLDTSPSIEGLGTRIGRYELLELIGEGGMGLVYLADQKEPVKRRVAFKIIKPGMDSKQVIARFEAERQALAVLDHPNIAHVFDAGTTKTGRPYFVMEHVKGMSITRYCDERKLGIEQRLRLFEQVCEGVHHAHQKGIIHRDLKPSNILVSVHGDRAVPKIIDFGIAKAITQPLTDNTFVTFQGQLLGTPEYMSPEQVDLATQDIDTRSDIYSLGVVLYELLAGVLPFEREALGRLGFAEVQRTIREQEPATPSVRLTSLGEEAKAIAASRSTQVIALARRLHRELEWIPLKAMRKERCRRYKSASEMTDDIRNYLNGNPLIAGPETAVYRVKKFVHKHAGSVATAVIIAMAIMLGFVISTAMYFRAEKARVRAEKAETAAQQQREVAEQAHEQEAIARVQAEEAEKVAQMRAEDYRRGLYVHTIQLAHAKYKEGTLGSVRKLLESCPQDLRSWEWYRLNHISDKAMMTINGHTDAVEGVAVSADGKYIASGSNDKTIKIWDASTGVELMTLRGHNGAIGTVSFSPDGKRVVSGSMDKTVKIWDWARGTELRTLRVQHKETDIGVGGRFSPDGKHIATWGWDNTIKIWDAETGEERAALRGGSGVRGAVAFSPDGTRIASGNRDRMIRVWNWMTSDEPMILRGHNHVVYSVAFSPDGKRIVSGGYDQTFKIWDAEDGTEVLSVDLESYTRTVEFSPDGNRIVSVVGSSIIKIWDATTGDELMTLGGHIDGVGEAVVFSPDGRRVISGGSDGTIKVWDSMVIDREDLILEGDKKWVLSLAFSPDSKRIVSGGYDGCIKINDTISGAEIMTLPGQPECVIMSVNFTSDGTRIISGSSDGMIKVWDAVNGNELAVFCHPKGYISSAVPSPDGKTVVFNSNDNIVRIWDLSAEGNIKTLCGHEQWVCCVAFSPSGRHVASGDWDGVIKLWDVSTGEEVMTLKRNYLSSPMYRMAFSPDGKRIVAGGGKLKVWNTETGSEVMTIDEHGGWLENVVFSSDGKRIIAASPGLHIWDVSTGVEIFSYSEGEDFSTVAVSPDGNTIATNGARCNILLLESTMPAGGYESRRVVQTAREEVEQLHKKLNSYHDVVDTLITDNTLERPVRTVALQITNARLWEDADMLNKECWAIVSKPGGDIEAYQMILERAYEAKDLEPDSWFILNTLGVAQYRVGSYVQALGTLNDAAKIRASHYPEPDHANLAFTAMALYHLDRLEEAQTYIEKLQRLFKEKETKDEKKWYPYLFEAEKILAGDNTKLYSAWEYTEKEDFEKALQLVQELGSSTDQENVEINRQIEGAAKWLARVYYNRAESEGQYYAGGVGHSNAYTELFADYEAVIDIDPEHSGALNALAWLRVICPVDEFRDEDKAVQEATKACELTDWKNHYYLSTLAAACSEIKDYSSAVKWQEQAIDLLGEDERYKWQGNYHQRLRLYESGKSYLMDSRWNPSEGELVSWWKFDKTDSDKLVDSSGNGLDGKPSGSAIIIKDPERGDVLSLDGKHSFVDCLESSAFEITASITVAAWIKIHEFNKEFQAIVSKGPYSWSIYGEDSGNNISFTCKGLSDDTCTSITGNVNDGKWHHVIGTYDSQKLCLYIDGNINNYVDATGLITSNQENVYVGTMNREISSEFNGLIDDVRIYSYAFSPEEVKTLYEGKEPPTEKRSRD